MRKHSEKEYPESAGSLFGLRKKQLGKRTGRIYAGPEPVEPKLPERDPADLRTPTMCVYAGPDYFSSVLGRPDTGADGVIPKEYTARNYTKPAEDAAHSQAKVPEAGEYVCQVCGAVIPETCSFCPSCGTPVVKKEPEA